MSVNSILVHCNIIHSLYVRDVQAPVFYNFIPSGAPGQKILEGPSNLIYLPVTVDAISTLSVWLTDQDGKVLDLRGEELTILAARVLPIIMSGLATGLLSDGVHKAISGSGVVEDGLCLHKHGKCYRVQKMKRNGLYLAPHPPFVEGDELFLKHGSDISDGAGLLIGKNSLYSLSLASQVMQLHTHVKHSTLSHGR